MSVKLCSFPLDESSNNTIYCIHIFRKKKDSQFLPLTSDQTSSRVYTSLTHNVELNCIFQQRMLVWNTHMQFQTHAYTSRTQQHISTMDGWHWRLTCGFKYVPRIYMNLYNVLKKSLHSSTFPEKIEGKKKERKGVQSISSKYQGN